MIGFTFFLKNSPLFLVFGPNFGILGLGDPNGRLAGEKSGILIPTWSDSIGVFAFSGPLHNPLHNPFQNPYTKPTQKWKSHAAGFLLQAHPSARVVANRRTEWSTTDLRCAISLPKYNRKSALWVRAVDTLRHSQDIPVHWQYCYLRQGRVKAAVQR